MKIPFALSFSIDDLIPEESAPAPDRVLAGAPRFRSWEIDAQPGGLYAGVWESTPGKWRVEYDEWEYCRLLSGVSIVTEEGGAARRLAAGDSLIIRPGFKGVWEVVETTRKEYVIRL
ncbi:MAG: cupin domain-containing protein [Parvularculaceae bacterium]